MEDRFKFRIFIKNEPIPKYNRMFKVHSLHLGTNKAIISSQHGNVSIKLDSNKVLMQSTGLKDKNGKLIFEGDKIRYAEYEIEDIEPDWEYDEIVQGIKHSYPAFDLANHQFDCNGLSYIFNEGWTIEVIGNIYENPELIKEGE